MADSSGNTLDCGHRVEYHRRGDADCLWCTACKMGYLACKHRNALLANFFAQKPLPGSFVDRSFIQRMLAIEPLSSSAVLRNGIPRLEQAARDKASQYRPEMLQQAMRCVQSMIATRDMESTRRQYEVIEEQRLILRKRRDENMAKQATEVSESSARDRTRANMDALGIKPPGSNANNTATTAMASDSTAQTHPAVAANVTHSRPASRGQTNRPPSRGAHLNKESDTSTSMSAAQEPSSATNADIMPVIEETRPGSTPPESLDDQLQLTTPRKRKQPVETTEEMPSKRDAFGARRSKTHSNATSVSPRIGRASLPGRSRRAPSTITDDDDKDSLVESSDDSLVDKSKDHIDRELRGISSAKMISLYTSLCREHKKFAADNLRKICRDNSFIAYWAKEQLKRSPANGSIVARSLIQLDGEMEGVEETAEDILAKFRGSAERNRPQSRFNGTPQKRHKSSRASFEPDDVSMANDDDEDCEPSASDQSAPSSQLPCSNYHAKIAPWPADTSGACQYHPGKLVWATTIQHPESWSEVEPQLSALSKVIKHTAWTCCRNAGETPGCTSGWHPGPGSESEATNNGPSPSSMAALAMRNLNSAATNQRTANTTATATVRDEDEVSGRGGGDGASDDSESSPPMLNTREFLEARMRSQAALANSTPTPSTNINNIPPHSSATPRKSTGPAGVTAEHNEIWADFPLYARADTADNRHKKARQIIAGAHVRYASSEGCLRCRRKGVTCHYSTERGKCALCCSSNQSRDFCGSDWLRGPGEQVPPNEYLLNKVAKADALVMWRKEKKMHRILAGD